jgi:kynurenine formamidase
MKEEVVVTFMILSEKHPKRTEETHDILPQLIVQRHARKSHEELSDHKSLKKYETIISEKTASWLVNKRMKTIRFPLKGVWN